MRTKSINQSINQSINRSIDRTINQAIKRTNEDYNIYSVNQPIDQRMTAPISRRGTKIILLTGRVLPGLEAAFIQNIMQRFPIIKRFVAIRYVGPDYGENSCREDEVRGRPCLRCPRVFQCCSVVFADRLCFPLPRWISWWTVIDIFFLGFADRFAPLVGRTGTGTGTGRWFRPICERMSLLFKPPGAHLYNPTEICNWIFPLKK